MIVLDGTTGISTPANTVLGNLSYTGTLTGNGGIVNLGSGQVYKDASGNVGIGTSSPTSGNGNVNRIIQVAASGNTSATVIASTAGTGLDNAGIFEARATAQSSGTDRLGQIYFGRDNTSTTALSAYMGFSTAASGTFAERARIDSSGNLLVNQTAVNGTGGKVNVTFAGGSEYGIKLKSSVSGSGAMAQFNNSANGEVGTITTTNTATAYNTSSDYRLKDTIAPMTGALARNALLNPVKYKWKVDGSEGEGFVAHELQGPFPSAVTGEKDAVDAEGKPIYQGIGTGPLDGHFAACINDLQAIIQTLTARITALEAQIV